MKTLIESIKTLHLWLHFSLIFALSLLPILTKTEIISNLVYLPVGYLVLAFISFNIENSLNKYLTLLDVEKPKLKEKKCLIYRGFCCLHS